MTAPAILGFDFDGVLCNGLLEYFQTSWQAYCQVWQPDSPCPPEALADRFYRLRPVVETGWEMPVVLRAVLRGYSDADIFQHWHTLSKDILAAEGVAATTLHQLVDGIRDRWIATDLESWLGLHSFYPGVIDRLQTILQFDLPVAIISTKEGRFIQQLLAQQGIDLTDIQIYGKEVKRPKYATIRELRHVFGPELPFWFIEDRLQALHLVQQQEDLQAIQLFLADWGYNTADEREKADRDPGIHLLSLEQFQQDFNHWIGQPASPRGYA